MSARKRMMVFVDVQNLLMACTKHTPKLHYDIEKLVQLLSTMVPDRELVDVCLYSGIPEPIHGDPVDQRRFDKQQGFFTKMKTEHGYRVFTKKTKVQECKCGSCGHMWREHRHKGIDVALAADLVFHGLADQYDIGMVVSGDSDFATVINKIRERRPTLRIEIAQFSWALGNELRESANMVHELDSYQGDFCS